MDPDELLVRRAQRGERFAFEKLVERHEQRLYTLAAPVEEPPDPVDPRDRFAEQELSGELQRALNALDDSYRVAVVLYDVLGCSYAEIAELTEVPEGTVKSRIFRGRSELAERLGTHAEPTESNL